MYYCEKEVKERLQNLFKDFIYEVKKDLKKRGSYWNPTLITGDGEGRVVVLRSLQSGKKEVEDFIIHTDVRSHKWKSLKEKPFANLVFYCPKRKWQVRLKAKARLNTQDIESKIEWERLKENSKKIYSLSHSPGSRCSTPEEAFVFEESSGYVNFGVITLEPISLDSLQLSPPTREDLHVRAFLNCESGEMGFLSP